MDPATRGRLIDRGRQLRLERERRRAPLERLSPREADVLRALAEGQTVARISRTSYVSEATVPSQVSAVLTKLGVSSQLEAVTLTEAADWL